MVAPLAVDLDLNRTPFSTTLRESTRRAHDRAHHSRYMRELFNGDLDLPDYARLAAQYWFIYQAIEEAADAMRGDPVGGRFVFDELRRLPALAADLEFLHGEHWRGRIEPVPATEDYVHRIRSVAFDWAGGYVAHHYTRYLGDLAGGQAVRKLLAEVHGVAGPGALFYRFDDIGSVPAFRRRYKALLDTTPWTEAERTRIVTEALVAFEFNIAVLDDLAK
ncbi:biliverdin-producing heme oxygenase [Amycolatopsis viridis]|uniref:Heme oxygenase n=1 Tax=Amycolatopsis viridis TaxID=185678 RepID=A0ABX0SMX8_9PSEU|nr:biliverdin-producing heme oxygenase [Amycolatopsis viridis]NIH78334.1 heme oxygenase [Amycolatopsis viridis]